MRGRYIGEAQAQVRAMLAVVDRAYPGALNRLRGDPLAELGAWTDLRVAMVPETTGVDRCSVAGSYEPQPPPPTLVVARSASYRRQGFTALHELGHHLQRTDLDLGEATFEHGDPELFEEESCDAFAAQVLLPDADLEQRINPRGPVAPGRRGPLHVLLDGIAGGVLRVGCTAPDWCGCGGPARHERDGPIRGAAEFHSAGAGVRPIQDAVDRRGVDQQGRRSHP